MNVIPFFRFVGSIVLGGMFTYIFFNLMELIREQETFASVTSGTGFFVFFAIWHAIPFIIMTREAVMLIMSLQKREGLM